MDRSVSWRAGVLFISGLVSACLALENPVGSATPTGAAATEQVEVGSVARFEHRFEQILETNYLLFTPKVDGAETTTSWPLIVYLHGGSGRGTDPARLQRSPLVERLAAEPDFPFAVLVPQCPPGRPGPLGDLWTEHANLVLAILDEVLASDRFDEHRVYLVGHSMGGNGAWYLGHLAAERFAALVPMSGPAVSWWAYRIAEAKTPVWVFHGELDKVVPIAESERMVETLRSAGGSVRFTRYPEGGHALREPFHDEELFGWLLEQRRE